MNTEKTDNNEKNDVDIISQILFFPSLKDNEFDYSIPLKNSISNFSKEQRGEATPNLFEYLCYKIIQHKKTENKMNQETIIISEKFLSSPNCKESIIKSNSIQKKFIFIPIRHSITHKWNAIIFVNLEKQVKQCMNKSKDEPIIAKIISSNLNSEEDDYILNTTMDKIENAFDFTSPEDIQFEVDSINISDQPNTSIFLLNFIEGLVTQENDSDIIFNYIMKLYDESSNTNSVGNNNYFLSFNRENEIFGDLLENYKNELIDYIKIKNNVNIDENLNKDNIFDLIRFEAEEEDFDSEEAALKIIARENEEERKKMEEQELFYSNNGNGNYKYNMGDVNNMQINDKEMLGLIQEVEDESEEDSEQKSKMNNQNNNSYIKKDDLANITNCDNTENNIGKENENENINDNGNENIAENLDNDDEKSNDYNTEDNKNNDEKSQNVNGSDNENKNENLENIENHMNENIENNVNENKKINNNIFLSSDNDNKFENNISDNNDLPVKDENMEENNLENSNIKISDEKKNDNSNNEEENEKEIINNELLDKDKDNLVKENENEKENILPNNDTDKMSNDNDTDNNSKKNNSEQNRNDNSYEPEINIISNTMKNNMVSLNNNLKKIRNEIITSLSKDICSNNINANTNNGYFRSSFSFKNKTSEKIENNASENKKEKKLSKSFNEIANSYGLVNNNDGNKYNNFQLYISNTSSTLNNSNNQNKNNAKTNSNRYNNYNKENNNKDNLKINKGDKNKSNANKNGKKTQNNNKMSNKHIKPNNTNSNTSKNINSKKIQDIDFLDKDNNNIIYDNKKNTNINTNNNYIQNLPLVKKNQNSNTIIINETSNNNIEINFIEIKNNYDSNKLNNINDINHEIITNKNSNSSKNTSNYININFSNNNNSNISNNLSDENEVFTHIPDDGRINSISQTFHPNKTLSLINNQDNFYKTITNINNNSCNQFLRNDNNNLISHNKSCSNIKSKYKIKEETLPGNNNKGNEFYINTHQSVNSINLKINSDNDSRINKLTLLDNFLYGKEFLNPDNSNKKEIDLVSNDINKEGKKNKNKLGVHEDNKNGEENNSVILRRLTKKRKNREPEKTRSSNNNTIDFLKEYETYDECSFNIPKDIRCGCGNLDEGCNIF